MYLWGKHVRLWQERAVMVTVLVYGVSKLSTPASKSLSCDSSKCPAFESVAVVVDLSMPRQATAEDIQFTDTGDVWMVLVWICLGLPPARRRPQTEQKKRTVSSATRMEAKIR